jgi:hypothetical protein
LCSLCRQVKTTPFFAVPAARHQPPLCRGPTPPQSFTLFPYDGVLSFLVFLLCCFMCIHLVQCTSLSYSPCFFLLFEQITAQRGPRTFTWLRFLPPLVDARYPHHPPSVSPSYFCSF